MARPSAAAGLLACAVLLLFAGQSSAGIFDYPFPLAYLFPAGYVPPIVRIYSKQDPSLNMAVDCNGKVVMVTATAGDFYETATQLWWKIPPLTTFLDGEGDKYWLVNVAEKKAMTSGTESGQAVQLEKYDPKNGAQLWVPSPPRPEDNGFYQIKPFTNDDLSLNGFYGVRVGTEIGIYHASPITSNTLWLTTNVFPCPFPG